VCIFQQPLILLTNLYAIVTYESQSAQPRSYVIANNNSSRPKTKPRKR